MTESKVIKSFFVLLVLFSVNFAVRAQNKSAPDISGRITTLNRTAGALKTKNLLGSILVERDEDATGEYDKADVKITAQTRIYAEADREKRAPLKIDALKLEGRVTVRFALGFALMSYPIQVGAAEIVILSGAPDSSQTSGNWQTVTEPLKDSNPELTKLRRSINAGNAVWVEAWERGDAQMILDTFTADGKELASGGKVYKGRKEILELMSDLMRKRGGRAKLTVTTMDFWLDGNTAFETGTAVYEFTLENKPQVLERRYFTIWKRTSKRGAWKIYANTGIAKK